MTLDGYKRFWTQDRIAVIVLVGAAIGGLQGKVAKFAMELNLPVLNAFVQWWPLLLIISGLILWLVEGNQDSKYTGFSSAKNETKQ